VIRRVAIAAFAGWVVGASSLAGCGGPMRPEELGRSVDSLASAAGEGQLVARDVALDRTKATFARARTRELGEEVDHEAEKVSDATPQPAIADEKSAALDLADEISQALGQVQISPNDRAGARAAERQLGDLQDRAERLAEGL
jgi:hypothetical protein